MKDYTWLRGMTRAQAWDSYRMDLHDVNRCARDKIYNDLLRPGVREADMDYLKALLERLNEE